jgi:cytochrome c biogenesis protein CcdA
MLSLLVLVVSVAVIDSINPSTLGPALIFALGRNGARDVALFTLGVFVVSTAGGLVLLLGPGEAVLRRVAKPSHHTVHLLELAAGIALFAAATVLWAARGRIRGRLTARRAVRGRSALFLGAGIMAAELPTAFPYIGALTAIVETDRSTAAGVLLVLVYNVLFVGPLLLVLAAVAVGGTRGADLTRATRVWLERHGAELIPAALALLGIVLVLVGAVGLR